MASRENDLLLESRLFETSHNSKQKLRLYYLLRTRLMKVIKMNLNSS